MNITKKSYEGEVIIMPESHSTKLAKIDTRLQLINEERLALLKDRQALITQHEADL
jgi:hypothetical protein